MLKDLLLNVIDQYAAHWEDLGTLLGMEDSFIANIARDYHNQSVDSCREMLMMWLRVTPSPTWGKLDDAINSLKKILASKPRSMFTHILVIKCYCNSIVNQYT